MKRTIALFSLITLTGSGCFDPEETPPGVSAETEGESSTGTGASESDTATTPGTGSSSGTTGATPTTATDTEDPSASTGEPSATDTDADDTTGEPQLGPRLEMSTPEDGDLDAALDGYFLLHFDRPISQNDALGHIFVTQGDGEPVLVAPQPCPRDADPQCVAGLFPTEFVDPDQGDLPGSTEHSIIVGAGLPDLDGNTNTLDQVVAFRTFEFTANFHDDSAALSGELGGMVYDPQQDALFLAGTTAGGGDCIVRRIDISEGAASPGVTVATPVPQGGGPYCYGMQQYDGTLFVDMSYSGDVRAYTNIGADDLNPFETVIADPTLPTPHNSLAQVVATAQVGSRRFFSFASFFGGPQPYAVLEFSGGGWSVSQSGQNLWPQDGEVSIATGSVGGTDYMFAHTGEHLYKFRVSDATVVADVEVEQGYNADVEVDGFGRVYVGSNGRFAVYDGDDLSELESRQGLSTGRFGIDPDEASTVVYFGRYRDPAVVGRMVIEF
ncbi:MAG: hypothetical protein ACRBN8_06980 [Nannocystales bacterium]